MNSQSSAQRHYQPEREQKQKARDEAEKQKPASEFENIILRKVTVNDLKQIYGESYDDPITQLIRLAKAERSRQGIIKDKEVLRARRYVPPQEEDV